jgi:hypothetical protein
MRRLLIILGLAATAAAMTLVGGAGAVGSYGDATGDSGAAPDVTRATVTSDAAGQIELRIEAAMPPAPSTAATFALLDTDMNVATGAPDSLGAEYLFSVDESDNSYGFAAWNGTDWNWDTPYSTVRVNTDSSGVTISVNRSELGNTGAFNFWVRTRLGTDDPAALDDAPNDGTWNYTLTAGGPEIRGVLVSTKPALGPVAAKPFVVTPVGLRLPPSDTGVSILSHPDTYACTARLAGRLLAGYGQGRCSWRLPKTARAKRLVVSLTVTYQGARLTTTLPYRVR